MKLTRILCLVMLAGLGSIQLNAQKSNANVTLTKLVDTSADNVGIN